MTSLSWRSQLARALHRNRALADSRYLQLATVGKNGRPANRTLVFRGFLGQTDSLQFATDARSAKVEQIEDCPWGEICWYFAKTREQFRISGSLQVIGSEDQQPYLQQARTQLWQNLSDPARLQFGWPAPAAPRSATTAFAPPTPDRHTPLPQFCLLLFDPQQVDHLELRGNPQNRWLYCRNSTGTWESRAVNP
uniref:Pyridoxamine 5'-phosphate oxidase-related FMN-binding n=1 Tax=Cyanothece sp. (strain PCC 7425 / ATCC 29141) TaxID=395961 RepID=B8HVY3_CYAP4